MGLTEGRGPRTVWDNPADIIRLLAPENPVMAFAPVVLEATAKRFLEGFPGLVTYAVKSNPDEALIRTLVAAGVRGFDVASPYEIDLIGRLAPGAARHYHNPVRSRAEIAHAVEVGIRAWSIDSRSELDKLFARVPAEGCEISARFKLPVLGAIYDFGSKFGASPELAADLLREIDRRGYIASLTFHPGTQCTDPHAWESYIETAAEIAAAAGVRPRRLNVGGGFPSHRVGGVEPHLEAIFDLIARTTERGIARAAPAPSRYRRLGVEMTAPRLTSARAVATTSSALTPRRSRDSTTRRPSWPVAPVTTMVMVVPLDGSRWGSGGPGGRMGCVVVARANGVDAVMLPVS